MRKRGHIISSIILLIMGINLLQIAVAKNIETDKKKIKAIIFDIGNVFVEVDLNRWKKAFKENDIVLPDTIFHDKAILKYVHEYGEGKLTTGEFANFISDKTELKKMPLEKFIKAWNSVILALNVDAINAIQKLRLQGYQLYALSDTNEAHSEYIEQLFSQYHSQEGFYKVFDKSYLSHLTGHSKNSLEAWNQIIKEQNLKPEECLFVDDLIENINNARRLGFNVFHYKPGSTIQDVINILNK